MIVVQVFLHLKAEADIQLGRLSRLSVLGGIFGFFLVSCTTAGVMQDLEETPVDSISTIVSEPSPSISCEGVSISNLAASYCSLLGYRPGTQETAEGQLSICTFPDGIVCDAWQFLRGKCGEEYSWCVLNGMSIQNVSESDGSGTQEYAVCVDSTGTIVGKVFELSGLQAMLEACARK
jgi:putative hemolysin